MRGTEIFWTEARKIQQRRFVLFEAEPDLIDGYLAANTDLMIFDDYLDRYYELPAEPVLTGRDRCDRCGGRAMVAVSVNRIWLLFCAHHSRQHAQALQHYLNPD